MGVWGGVDFLRWSGGLRFLEAGKSGQTEFAYCVWALSFGVILWVFWVEIGGFCADVFWCGWVRHCFFEVVFCLEEGLLFGSVGKKSVGNFLWLRGVFRKKVGMESFAGWGSS